MTPEQAIAALRANAAIKLQQYNIENEVGTDTAVVLFAEYQQCLLDAERVEAQMNGTLKTEFSKEYDAEQKRLRSEITDPVTDLNELKKNADKKREMIALAYKNGDLETACELNNELIGILNNIRIAEIHQMQGE